MACSNYTYGNQWGTKGTAKKGELYLCEDDDSQHGVIGGNEHALKDNTHLPVSKVFISTKK